MGADMGVLTGKVALVTGGSRGIGAAIARALAADGADVAISYVMSGAKADAAAQEIEALGVRSLAIEADQADVSQAESLVTRVVERFGRLDILVNNAGIVTVGRIGDAGYDMAAVARLLAINLAGVVATVFAAAPLMGEGGRIISIGSAFGTKVGFPGVADYAASKAAIAAYTRSWAWDLGPRGITVNNVQPGPVDTDMNPADGSFSALLTPMTALGRYGRPEEVSAFVSFLASPSSSFITGASLDVDGGLNA